eukprot:scaffold4978_cov117-Isochrysis_galbana.AAC.3
MRVRYGHQPPCKRRTLQWQRFHPCCQDAFFPPTCGAGSRPRRPCSPGITIPPVGGLPRTSSESSRILAKPSCVSADKMEEARKTRRYVSSRTPRAFSPVTPSVGLCESILETTCSRSPGALSCATSGTATSAP